VTKCLQCRLSVINDFRSEISTQCYLLYAAVIYGRRSLGVAVVFSRQTIQTFRTIYTVISRFRSPTAPGRFSHSAFPGLPILDAPDNGTRELLPDTKQLRNSDRGFTSPGVPRRTRLLRGEGWGWDKKRHLDK